MKILKIWPTFQTELKYHDHYLSEVMQSDGVQTTFLASDKMEKEFLSFLSETAISAGEDTYKGSKIIRLKSFEFMRKPFITDIKKMYQEVCNGHYDVIHIFGIGTPIGILTLMILKLCKKSVPVFINDHSNPLLKNMSLVGAIYYKINRFLFSILKKDVKLIITPNAASKEFICEHYSLNKEKVQIIPLGYDSDIFAYSNPRNRTSPFTIGFAGKIVPGKNIELLIDVLSELDHSNIDCIIVGLNTPETDYQQQLRQYAQNKGLNLAFKPLIRDPHELSAFYNSIDLAVFPGSISITTLEASGCGTPVLIYNSIKGLEDRVEDGRGFLFNTKEELKAYILHYQKQKQNGMIDHLSIAEESKKYAWQSIAGRYLNIYRNHLSTTGMQR